MLRPEGETREQQIDRLIKRHVKDRNMDPRSIEERYRFTHVGVEIDPDFFEARLDLGHGFFRDEPRHLDHITRMLLLFVFLSSQRAPGSYHQGKKGVMMGATYEQMVEALEVAHVAGGGMMIQQGLMSIDRMKSEGLVPGCQDTPWTNYWVKFPYKEGAVNDPVVKLPMTIDEIEASIRAYYIPEFGGEKIAEDLVYAARLDPEYWMRYCRLAWGVYHEKPAFLDPIRREMLIMAIYASQLRNELVEFHMRRALAMGAPVEALLEALEVTFVGAGNRMLFEGIRILRSVTGN